MSHFLERLTNLAATTELRRSHFPIDLAGAEAIRVN